MIRVNSPRRWQHDPCKKEGHKAEWWSSKAEQVTLFMIGDP